MNFVLYLHHQLYPKLPEMKRFNCSCGRTLLKMSAENIVVTNDIGLPPSEYPPSQHMIDIRCHSCKSNYRILFQ